MLLEFLNDPQVSSLLLTVLQLLTDYCFIFCEEVRVCVCVPCTKVQKVATFVARPAPDFYF